MVNTPFKQTKSHPINTMTQISASQVNELRKQTGAGMMDCKKALVEANGDMDIAVDVLRKQGQKIAAKRSDRDAREGVVLGGAKNGVAAILVLNCETDFVAKTDSFVSFANDLLNLSLDKQPASVEDLQALPYGNGTVAEAVTDLSGKTGEKVEVRSLEYVKAATVVAYNHPGNKVGSIVGLNKGGDFESAAKDVAMQIAAMAPVALNKDTVPQSVIDKEIEIGKELAIQEGKPEDMAEKIAVGRLNKFFKESTLLEQVFVKDGKISVKEYLTKADKDLTVTDFKRFSLN
jgi:elongation factor Ts